MRRQSRSIEVPLRALDVATAGHALMRRARAMDWPRPRVRVRADGRVRARLAEFSRFNTPPVLVGWIDTTQGGGMLTATIRESYIEVCTPRMFVGLAVFLALVCAGLLAGGEVTNPGVYVCGVGGTALGLIGYTLGRLRPGSFRRQADRLERAVRTAAGA